MHTQWKKLMDAARIALAALLAGLMLSPVSASASDIDIYSGLTSATGAPNVLLILDNAANFTSNYSGAVCSYASGGAPSLGGDGTGGNPPVNGSIEQCALSNVIDGVQPNADGTARVNIGIMVYNGSGIVTQSGGACSGTSGNGGCLVYPITPMTAANKTALLSYIHGWTKQTISANGEATAETMQEAWTYLHGSPTFKSAPSGTTYTTPISQNGCQKTYVIFIANALGSNGTPGEGGSVTPGQDLKDIIGADAALSSAQKTQLSTTLQIPSGTYGINGVFSCAPDPYVMGSHSESSGLYADEWAQYMAGTDLFTGAQPPNKGITTYTIGVVSPSCVSDYPALLTNMAYVGGGKYAAVANATDLTNVLASILNEVQAVNSVFSSATLPVSVNTQGTYLNQLYMGMFRPDQNAAPRWVGNVKQYQFAFDTNKNLYLADATQQPALSASGTGFLSTDAASFWSCTNTTQATDATVTGSLANQGPAAPYMPYSYLPTCDIDPAVGFWANNPTYANYSTGHAFDLQDGEIVEKGGAGQMLRLETLYTDYTQPAGTQWAYDSVSKTITTAGNPRRLYTLCPGGLASCSCTTSPQLPATPAAVPQNGVINGATVCVDLTDATNSFAGDNTALVGSNRFGGQSGALIATLTEANGMVTATTTQATNFANGDTVTISGATPNDYNGTFTISNVATTLTSTTFQYPVTEDPPSPATGQYMVQAHQPALAVSAVTRTYTANANPSPNPDVETATVTTVNPHGYAVGATVVMGGGTSAESAYNGQHTIATVPTTTSFTYPVTITPPATASNQYTISLHNKSPIIINTISLQGSKATVTTASAHGFVTGDVVTIANTFVGTGVSSCFDQFQAVVSFASSTSFTYTVSACGSYKSATGGTATAAAADQTTPKFAITRTGTTNPATATVTLPTATQFATGDQVDVKLASGSATNEALYTGTLFTITCLDASCSTFKYSVPTNPIYPGSANHNVSLTSGAIAASSVTRSSTLATLNLSSPLTLGSPPDVDVFVKPGTTAPASESAYQGTFTVSCPAATNPCSTLTYTVALSPTSPATGSTIKALDTSKSPQSTDLVNWVRGADNVGDEASLCKNGASTPNCPTPGLTVRPSIHGDALHSRPIAVNYGGSVGVVVYYGTNDGVYHAINGNQPPCNPSFDPTNCPPTTPPPSTMTDSTHNNLQIPPGGELWGFIAPDFYAKLNRQRLNSPQILLPGMNTNVPPVPLAKDYFIDGPTGLLQEVDGNGNTVRAIIYVGARRGGHLLYAIDVTDPFHPWIRWKLDNSAPNMDELGQTWSLPKVAMIDGYVDANNKPSPVVIMGAGYDDGAEDAEPPISTTTNGGGNDTTSDNIGRGIYVLDAFDGHVIWEAKHFTGTATYPVVPWPGYWERAAGYNPAPGGFCSGTPPAAVVCLVGGMNHSVPADITLMDVDADNLVDRLYATDTGGNVWRVDLHPTSTSQPDALSASTPDKWVITQLAALGCHWGPCSEELHSFPVYANPVPTPRKFFFPAEVIGKTSLNNYDAVFVGSGDREHPLKASTDAYNVVNRMYMIKDFNVGNDASSQTVPITEGGAFLNSGATNAVGIPASLADCTGGTCFEAPVSYSSPPATSTGLTYDKLNAVQQGSGYYFSLGTGEKVVNAPLTTAGYVYFGTNQPVDASALATCKTNLGTARGYQLSPFSAQYASVTFSGGGLPPSPVSGIVNIQVGSTNVAAPFCVGCPSPLTGGNNCTSALAACKPTINVPAIRRRDYWYTDTK